LAAHGIGFIPRKIVNRGSCTVVIIKNKDGSWTVNNITAFRTGTATYTLGERYTLKHPVTLSEINGVVLLDEESKLNGKCFASETSYEVIERTTRELLPNGQMLQVIYFKDVVCNRYFEKE
jgi:hypothetical protein